MKSLNLKSWVLAASFVFASVSANAATFIGLDTAASLDEENYVFGNNPIPGTSFDDLIAVYFGGPRDFVGTISGTGTTGFDFSAFDIVKADLSTVATGTIGADTSVKFAFADFSGSSLVSGTYFLHIVGTKSGTASYVGSISAVAPVPEAETYSMMLAGLGLMGFVARRRKV